MLAFMICTALFVVSSFILKRSFKYGRTNELTFVLTAAIIVNIFTPVGVIVLGGRAFEMYVQTRQIEHVMDQIPVHCGPRLGACSKS